MQIIGAGAAGILCGLMNPSIPIYEKSPVARGTSRGIVRFKTDKISNITSIPLKRIKVFKGIWYQDQYISPNPMVMHQYSKKVSNTISIRSISNLDPVERFAPHPEYFQQLSNKLPIQYGTNIKKIDRGFLYLNGGQKIKRNGPLVSTMPMNYLAKLLDIDVFKMVDVFKYQTIYVTEYPINDANSYCTVYYPDPQTSVYRVSLNGNSMIIESMEHLTAMDIHMIQTSLGLSNKDVGKPFYLNFEQKFGKIVEIDQSLREHFMLQCTMEFNIYALGRFATWRPKLMLDDVIDDIKSIGDLIGRGIYGSYKIRQKEF